MSTLIASTLACALAVGAVLLSTTGVHAHARLDESSPAVGEVLATSPTQVSITFSQDVQKITGTYGIDVLDETGAEITTVDAVLNDDDRRIMTVELPPSLPVGRYIVEYQNVSDEDGDPFEGAYAFYVGRDPTPQELAADEELVGEEGEATPTIQAEGSPTAAAEQTAPAAATSAPPADTDGDDDSGGNITLFLVIGAIALIAVLISVGFVAFSRRQGA